MKKLNFFAIFFTVICSNAQTKPCSPWPWCIQQLEAVVVTPWRPPIGPPPPYITPKPPALVPNIPSPNIPCPGTPMKDMKLAPANGWNNKGGTYGYTRKDEYGNQKFHDGIDIAGDVGSDIYNMYEGTVKRIESSFAPGQYGSGKNGYGNYVQIETNLNGEIFTLKYNHLNSISNIKVGERVSQGQVIGKLGKTGNAAAKNVIVIPHVQAMDANGKSTNPDKYLNGKINKQTGNIIDNCK